jgi:hypothetical protein
MRFGSANVSPEQRLADLENTLTLVKLDPVENAALLFSTFRCRQSAF